MDDGEHQSRVCRVLHLNEAVMGPLRSIPYMLLIHTQRPRRERRVREPAWRARYERAPPLALADAVLRTPARAPGAPEGAEVEERAGRLAAELRGWGPPEQCGAAERARRWVGARSRRGRGRPPPPSHQPRSSMLCPWHSHGRWAPEAGARCGRLHIHPSCTPQSCRRDAAVSEMTRLLQGRAPARAARGAGADHGEQPEVRVRKAAARPASAAAARGRAQEQPRARTP